MISKTKLTEILKFIILSIFIGFILFFTADISLKLGLSSDQVSAFYIPTGLSIAILIIFGVRFLPVIFLSLFILGVVNNRLIYENLISVSASAIEAYIGYFLYKSFHYLIEEYFEYHSTLATVCLVGLLAPIFSAIIGVTNLYYVNVVPETSYFTSFLTWYSGNLLSIFIILPAFISFGREKHRIFDFFAPVIALGFALLFKYEFMAPYIYLLFLTILIPVIFGSITGMYYSLMAIAIVMNWFLITNIGPFSEGIFQSNMHSMQLFLLAITLTALTLEGFKKTNLLKNSLLPLISFWLITGALYFHYHVQKDLDDERIISNLTLDFEHRLSEKMSIYENSMKGASGFVIGSEEITKAEWSEYVSSISVVDEVKGVQGVGVIFKKLQGSNKPSFIYPEGLNQNFENLINQPMIIDLIEESKNFDNPILSQAININLDGKSEKLISFLISSVKKNEKFIAWIIAPIEMGSFFKSIVNGNYPSFDIDVFEGDSNSPSNIIYSKVIDPRFRSTTSLNSRVSTVTLAGHTYNIDWGETIRYVVPYNSQNSLLILIGSFISMILTAFFLNLKLIGVKANQIAESKTFELNDSKIKFKSLFENSSDAVILFKTSEIIDCNPESLNLFGKRSKEELINTPLFDFFSIRDLTPTDDTNLFETKVREVKLKRMVKFECFCLRSGIPFFAEMHLHYIEVNDKFIYQAVVRDISERKKIEQNLTKSKEFAEEAARVKSNFLSTISHEMRTPLNGIIGMVNIIIGENPKTEIRENLETIRYSADNLLHIVNEVLDYNKIESGKISLEKKLFNVKGLCENILKIHGPKASEKNLQLRLIYDPKIPEEVIGDEFRNTQILNNLLSNSLKFTDSGEVILNVRLKQKKETTCIIEFKVIDTGIGIETNKQREIFKDFTQAKSEHTRKYGGTGLGLAITKRLVEIQNGKIEVMPNNTQGTCFIYTIQFSLRPEVLSNPSNDIQLKDQIGFQGQKILLVEDNHVNIIVTKKFLEKWGLKVDVAINGLEAVNHARAIEYDLILMDLHMPLMDGFEATKKIREFNKDTPIVGLSADVMTESVASLQAIGMNDFVTKPFRPNDFFIKLKSFI